MFAEDSPVDVMEAVSGDQAVPAGGAGETLPKKKSFISYPTATLALTVMVVSRRNTNLQVVNAALCSHHHLTGRYGLSAGAAGSTVSKQSAGRTHR